MADTLLLDLTTWDLVVDVYGNIAVATSPYSQAQDAASAIKTFQGEVYYNTTLGVNYSQILGTLPPIALMKQQFSEAALTVPGVATEVVYISSISNRTVSGQVQITNEQGQVSVAPFGPVVAPPPQQNFILGQSTLGGPNVLG
jgi:hypothetical protein